jgi:thioredoxin reductase (NADPH)
MSVDDDPEVLGAIERDLRSHYAAEYRILRAGSADEALAASRQLKERGAPVAMFLVDQRMPGMTGTELLAQVQRLHPQARKVLLTAYADTEAAIASINEIGLDHYLMKPWDPPEERLYPVLDDLLQEWVSHVRLPFDGIRVAGARWSPESYAVKEFLSRNQVPYQWIDVDQDGPTRELVSSLPGGLARLPAVFFPDGATLMAPTHAALAEKAGLQVRARLPFYDVVIVGGGPAGLANAVYGASEGLKTVVVEQSAPGGQAGTSSRIENYLGFPSGVTGADLAQRATSQARRFGAEILSASEVTGIRRDDPYRVVRVADGSEVSTYAVVIATGMSVRMLEVPGIQPLVGIGVFYGAAMTEAVTYKDQDVCVVGGANSAGQGAIFFSRYARSVTMLVRAADLGPSMSQYLVDRIRASSNIIVRSRVEVACVNGTTGLENVRIRNVDTGAEEDLSLKAMFVFIGTAPRSEMVRDFVLRDPAGFILTGPDIPRVNGKLRGWPLDRDPFLFETSVPGVFAAGDVRAGANRRVAAAVGEGSAAIFTVQRYLQTV